MRPRILRLWWSLLATMAVARCGTLFAEHEPGIAGTVVGFRVSCFGVCRSTGFGARCVWLFLRWIALAFAALLTLGFPASGSY
jgi:hypothetical protein